MTYHSGDGSNGSLEYNPFNCVCLERGIVSNKKCEHLSLATHWLPFGGALLETDNTYLISTLETQL